MSLSRRRFLRSVSSAAVWAPYSALAASSRGRGPAQFLESSRVRAIQRGLAFIYKLTRVPRNFSEYGTDFLWCFYSLGSTAKDPWLRDNALKMGRERALVWRRQNRTVPPDAGADDIADLVFGYQSADALGFADANMLPRLRTAAAKFGPMDYIQFDPAAGRVPADAPAECGESSPPKPHAGFP